VSARQHNLPKANIFIAALQMLPLKNQHFVAFEESTHIFVAMSSSIQ